MPKPGSTPKFEQELLQLRLGLKSAIKAEHVTPDEEAWLRQKLARAGLEVIDDLEPLPSNRAGTEGVAKSLFCGADRALLEELRACSRTQRSRDASSAEKRDAIFKIGEALGYPRCCVAHYVSAREFPDQSLVFLRPAFATEGIPDALLNPSGNDELVSHVPCSYGCQASLTLAARTADALRAADPIAWQARWLRMQQPVLVLESGHLRFTPTAADEPRLDRVSFSAADASRALDPELEEAIAIGDALTLTPSGMRLMRGDQVVLTRARPAPLDLPILLRWSGAPRRRVKVALVDLHRSLVDYMDTMTLALFSGDLTQLGVPNEVVRLYVDRQRPDTWQRSLDALAHHLLDGEFTLAVWNMTYDDGVVRRLAQAGIPNVLVDARFAGVDAPFDWVLTNPNRQGFCRLVRELSEGRSVPRVPELHYRDESKRWARTALLERLPKHERIDDATFWPNTSYVTPAGEHAPASDVWHLCVNPGCPYGKRLDDNPHFAGVKIPETASLRGCSFCEEGGDYEGAPADPTMRSLLHQLEYVARRSSHARYILLERAVFRFLPRFLRGAKQVLANVGRGAETTEFFVTARADEIVRERDRLYQALEVATELEQRVNLYLVGIENFAQNQLDLFNKGATVEQHVQACEIMREMGEAFPRAFTATRNAAHGFLLFTPWTTLADLEDNAAQMRRTRIWEIRSESTLSKLRLYPTVPLYYKAAQEGLLAAGYEDARLDSSERLGYSKEVPWIFAHPETDAVYRLLVSLVDDYPRGPREIDLLEAAIEEVRRHGPGVAPAEFAQRWQSSRLRRQGLGRQSRLPLTLGLANTCNLGCTFCNRKSELPAPERRALAQALLDGRAKGHDQLVLGGAEPLMSGAVLWAAGAARKAGYVSVALETNTLGLDAERIRRLADAGVTRIMPFLPGWSPEVISVIAREPDAGALIVAVATAIDASGLEVLPVVPVARETLANLDRFVDLVSELYPSARGIGLRFFPSDGGMPHQLEGEQPLTRMVENADGAGFRVYQAGDAVVPPCAFDDVSSLRDLLMLDGPLEQDVSRIAECDVCVLRERCAGVSASFHARFPGARLAPVRTVLRP